MRKIPLVEQGGKFFPDYIETFWNTPTTSSGMRAIQKNAKHLRKAIPKELQGTYRAIPYAIQSHFDKSRDIDPDKTLQLRAYLYLEQLFLARNERLAELGEAPLEGVALKEKMRGLFEGLTRYFQYGDYFQERGIKLATRAARNVLLSEAFFMMLDSENGIDSEEELKEVLKGTIRTMFPKVMGHDLTVDISGPAEGKGPGASRRVKIQKEIVPELLQAVIALRKAEGRDRVSAAENLREKIAELARTLKLPKLKIDYTSLDDFREGREEQTRAINKYTQELEDRLRALGENGGGNTSYRRMLIERLEQIEAFRSGYMRELPPQSDILARHNQEDIPTLYRKMDDPMHPLIEEIMVLQNNLNILAKKGEVRATYKRNPPGLNIIESGIKSWKRTIEKLVNEKNGDWDKVTDVARLNVVFDRPETMYLYNRELRTLAQNKYNDTQSQNLGEDIESMPNVDSLWKIDGPESKGSFTDKGIRVQPTGDMLWLMKFHVGNVDGHPWGVEIKLDDRVQRNIEEAHHKLYKCMRLLPEGQVKSERVKKHTVDKKGLTIENCRNFFGQTLVTLESLERYSLLPPGIPRDWVRNLEERALQNVELEVDAQSPAAIKEYVKQALGLRQDLARLHVAMCCVASSASAPGMAALYRSHFSKMTTQLRQTNKSDAIQFERIYAEYGPRLVAEDAIGGFKQRHINMVDRLETAYRESWKGPGKNFQEIA